MLQVNGRNLDFRARSSGRSRGQLRVVAIPVRIARDRSPITTHAKSMALEELPAGIRKRSRIISTFIPGQKNFSALSMRAWKSVSALRRTGH